LLNKILGDYSTGGEPNPNIAAPSTEYGFVNTNEFTPRVEQRTSGITWIKRCIRLQIAIATNTAQDASCQRS
jgi:hypothetical protein